MKTRAVLLAVACLPLFANVASAKPQMAISITTSKEVTETRNGVRKTTLIPTQTAASGEILHYTLAYANKGNEEATNTVVVDPIPAGTVYIANSATGKGAEINFSSDGGKTYDNPVKLTYEMRLPGGKVEKRIATPGEYTNIRWTIKSVPPGASGTLGFAVTVK